MLPQHERDRLQKVMARAGIASRRGSEKLIQEGRVSVNGQVVTELGIKVDPHYDHIQIDGQAIAREPSVYYLFNKPTGVITSVTDPQKRKVVLEFFRDIPERIYPVGRLDYDTSGLLILTNDGELTHRMMHPSFRVEKTYIATVQGFPHQEDLDHLAQGMTLKDGPTAPAQAEWVSRSDKKNESVIRLTIHEGRKRQVRRMFSAIGHRVKALHREKYAFLTLAGLKVGEYRSLTEEEIDRLKSVVT